MKKILIIDDSSAFSSTLVDTLPKDKYIAITAQNGHEGYEKFITEKPDLVILDMKMPEMNGLEFLKKLSEEKIHTKILISSEFSQSKIVGNAIDFGLEVGVIGYITKSSESTTMILKEIESILHDA
jgi:DNA-binding NarL/FixJ family response regulator